LSLWSIRKAPRIESAAQVNIAGMFGLVFANKGFVVMVPLYGVMTTKPFRRWNTRPTRCM
jgi:GPH family glycoside/pentoside/hexuronide:cation symporter